MNGSVEALGDVSFREITCQSMCVTNGIFLRILVRIIITSFLNCHAGEMHVQLPCFPGVPEVLRGIRWMRQKVSDCKSQLQHDTRAWTRDDISSPL